MSTSSTPARARGGRAPASGPDLVRLPVLRRGLGVLAMSIRLCPRPFAAAVGGALLYAIMTVGAAVVFGRVTDRVVVPAFDGRAVSATTLAVAAGAIVGVAVLKSLGVVVRRIGATKMMFALEARFRRRVTERYHRLPLSWHRRHTTGELLSNAGADVEAAFSPLAPLPFALGVLVMLGITAVYLLVTDVVLTLVGFLVGPALVIANWRFNMATVGPATRAQQARADVSAVAHESVDGALVVKTLGREQAETERFRARSERLRAELVHLGRIRALFDPVMEVLPQLGVLLVLLVGSWRIVEGQLSAGDLVQFAFLFILLAFPIRAIGFVLGELPRAVVGWERVARVLRARGDLDYGDDEPDGHRRPARADVDAVSFRYADAEPDGGTGGEADGGAGGEAATVLHDVTFSAPEGRTVAIVGTTGSGKSTIAHLLVRLADPEAGAVRLDGRDLRALRRGVLPRSVAIVFQHPFLFDDTVRGNVTLGEPYDDDAVREALRLAQAEEFVDALPDGLDTRVGERGATLSGGQRQRIALARALVRTPRLLVLDDATSSVDPTVEARILEGLAGARLPSTVVVIAYRRRSIALADEIVFVQGGRIVDRGRHDELLERCPAYARVLTAYDRVVPGEAR